MKFLFVLLVGLFVSQVGYGSPLNDVNYTELESYVEKLMKEFKVPGLAIGIVNKNGPIYMKGFGVRGVEDGISVTADTQFAIGSTTKAFTATSLGILVDRKIVEWDKSIKAQYLHDFELLDPVSTKLITIRDLLTHRTGLPRHDLAWYGTPFSREELYHKLKYLEPTAGIREKTQYQNEMYMVAGYLLGQVMNTTWEDFVSENIFKKIGMTNSNFSVNDMQIAPDFAYPHSLVNDKLTQIPFRNIDSVAPAGSINSSVRDMGKWLRVQLNNGKYDGEDIVSAETLSEIHRPQMVSTNLGFNKLFEELGTEMYSMGWFYQNYLGKRLIHHGGGIDGFITFVGFLPDHDIGIVVFGNSGSLVPYFAAFGYLDLLIKGKTGPWAQRLKDLMKPKTPELVDPTPTPLPLIEYAGVFTHPAYGELSVSVDEDKQVLNFSHYVVKYELMHYQENSFLPVGANDQLDKSIDPVTFLADSSGKISGLLFKADEKANSIEFVKDTSHLSDTFSLFNFEIESETSSEQNKTVVPLNF